jgi:hypothetical protein
MRGLTIDELDGVSGGFARALVGSNGVLSQNNEMAAMQLQSVMSQRSQQLTMFSNMVQSMSDANKNTADNIGK